VTRVKSMGRPAKAVGLLEPASRMYPRGTGRSPAGRRPGLPAPVDSRQEAIPPRYGLTPLGRRPLTIRRRVTISGVVQGVGFRPYLWRRAEHFGLAGWVRNETGTVVVEVQGEAGAVAGFFAGLAAAAPPLAVVDRVRVREIPVAAAPSTFRILASEGGAGESVGVPADVATCAACLAEVSSPGNRRHRYPFTNCTDCGPRFTIIDGLPYDRSATTMRAFAMCPACAAEYEDPADRRFHAQPNACPACGPTIWWTTTGDRGGCATERPQDGCLGDAALDAVRRSLASGGIVAIKGIGGFHLACDATDEAAVGALRARKQRPTKPLAVMVADAEQARRIARVDEGSERLLAGLDRPIVILDKLPASRLAIAVAPGCDVVGVMLPYAPLHHLLCAGMPPLVMTSGNVADEPIAYDNRDAVSRLAGIADGFLMHDRPIVAPCDDSVVRCVDGLRVPIRRSRGHAPLPIALPCDGPPVLAVGGELKAAPCVARGMRAWMAQHVGDVTQPESLAALAAAAGRLLGLCHGEPAAVVADLHPGYLSSAWARDLAAARGLPLVPVQHHEAHAASLLAEHGGRARAIVACFDGTGYGRDGTAWGGEFFVVEGPALRRAAHLEPFALPGGDACARHPWRTALSLLRAASCGWDDRLPPARAARGPRGRVLLRQLERRLQCPVSSSMGRLFDAVGALVGAAQSVDYEAEAAVRLEALAAAAGGTPPRYEFTLGDGAPIRVGWAELVRDVARDAAAGRPPRDIAAGFHEAVARMIVAVCARLADAANAHVVGLTGGVFQNAILLKRTSTLLRDAGFEVLVHRQVPCNDGGLALGQAVLARAWLSR
jgi:hydrogenase maturation protein HypF